jgi:hypothetical protein
MCKVEALPPSYGSNGSPTGERNCRVIYEVSALDRVLSAVTSGEAFMILPQKHGWDEAQTSEFIRRAICKEMGRLLHIDGVVAGSRVKIADHVFYAEAAQLAQEKHHG